MLSQNMPAATLTSPPRSYLQIEVRYGVDLGQPRQYLILRSGADDALWLENGRLLIGPANDFSRPNKKGRLVVPHGSGYCLYLAHDSEGQIEHGAIRDADRRISWAGGRGLLEGAEAIQTRPGFFRQILKAPVRGELVLPYLTLQFTCLVDETSDARTPEPAPMVSGLRQAQPSPEPTSAPINPLEEIPRHWLGRAIQWVWNWKGI